ncbi:MAG: MarR family winged helix-turn-helix transcriptional regulator [Steroidobacteraceae bacterium]
MSTGRPLAAAPSADVTRQIRDSCMCLRAHRTARILGRRFDRAFKELGLTNGQFSLMMSLNRPHAPNMRSVATLLAIDRTTLTAALKPLERRGLVASLPDPDDLRSRLVALTPVGRSLLARAVPIWRATHDVIERALPPPDRSRLLDLLNILAEQPDRQSAHAKPLSDRRGSVHRLTR